MILKLRRRQVYSLEKEARKIFPVEACALLFGETTQEEVVVKRVVITSNRLQSTIRFEMDSEAFARAFFEAEKEGLELIGLFHSHPAPAAPSPVDVECMKLWGDAIWLIFSSIDGNLAAYQMKNDKIVEVTIKAEP